MADFIKSPLEYFEISKGKARLVKQGDYYNLSHNNRKWMGYHTTNFWQAQEFVVELNLAYGVCVTTGLGLGIIQTLLCSNDKVSKVIVYEKNKDIIDIFYSIIEKNNFDISKIEIINQSADEMKNQICDCLFLDHFEGESETEILDRVSKIEANNTCNLLWYWPAGYHYITFLEKKRKKISLDSYIEWKNYTGLNFLPSIIEENVIENLKYIREVYLKNADGRMHRSITDFDIRNKLIEKFGNRRKD